MHMWRIAPLTVLAVIVALNGTALAVDEGQAPSSGNIIGYTPITESTLDAAIAAGFDEWRVFDVDERELAWGMDTGYWVE